jgi:DHA2 family multidrug resistance protein-like MFS transporter
MAKSKPVKATQREWMGLVVIALACMLYSMDLTVLHLAVPRLTAELQPNGAQLLWIVDIYGFFVAGSLITMGTLGDRIGRRRLLMIGAAAFGVASVLAAVANTAALLIVARAVLGIAGATLAPSTLSLIRNMFHDEKERNTAIGVWGASFSAGGLIGPVVGGVMLEYFWTGSVFLVAVPIMVALLVLGPRLLPEFKDPQAGKLDLLSALLSMVAVLAVIYGLKQFAQHGFSLPPLLVIVAGLAIGAVFVRRQQTLSDPLIDLKLFKVPAFSVSVAINLLAIFVMFGISLFLAQYLQLVAGLSPLQAGLWMLPSGVMAVLGSLTVPVVVNRVRPIVAMIGGLIFLVLGFSLLTLVDVNSGFGYVIAASLMFPLGVSPVVLVSTGLVMGIAPPERAGAAAAISETGAELGGALGIAVMGSVATAVYRAAMVNAPGLENLSAEVALGARSTLGAAMAVAQQLAGEQGTALLGAAREGFLQAFHAIAALNIGLVLVAAVLAVRVLRNVKSVSEAH